MANAAIAYLNLADRGSVSASSQELQMPAERLLSPHIGERWRSRGNSAFIVADLGTAVTLDTLCLFGLTLSDAATVHLRVSTIDPSGAAGDVFDSGMLASRATAYFDSAYGALVYPLPAPVEARYVRFDLSDPVASFVEAGRVAAFLRESFTINFAYGWQVQWVDRSAVQKTRGGQSLVWRDNSYRVATLSFEYVEPGQRYGLVEAIDRVNGRHVDVLMMIDAASDNLARDTVFGLVSDLTPVVQSVFEHFSKQYKVEERL